MKRSLLYLLALPALALTGTWLSCSNETDDGITSHQGRVPVQIEKAEIAQTRAALDGYLLPDTTDYGVFVTATNSPTSSLIEDGNNRRVAYVKGVSTWDTPVFIPEGGYAYVWAYWPYNRNYNQSVLERFQLETNSQIDYLVGRAPQAAYESSPKVTINLSHAMSRLHIIVRNDTANTNKYSFGGMTVSNVYTSGEYYFSSNSVKETKQGSITLKPYHTTGEPYVGDFLIVPSSSYITARLSLPGTDFADVNLPSYRYLMGRQYNVEVVINIQKELVINNVWISEWQTINKDPLEVFADNKIGEGTEEPTPNPTDDHEAVDLGLSVKWATMNVGADKPEASGGYYAWGETSPRGSFGWNNYKYCSGSSNSLTKYCSSSSYGVVDTKLALEASDDAATVQWGSRWHTPTIDEWRELDTKCSWKWTTKEGRYGMEVTSRTNGNSIFLPATGGYTSSGFLGSTLGSYWAANLYGFSSHAYCIRFGSGGNSTSYFFERCNGVSIRPVTK